MNGTNIFVFEPNALSGPNQVLEELPAIGATPTATYTLGSAVISQKRERHRLALPAGWARFDAPACRLHGEHSGAVHLRRVRQAIGLHGESLQRTGGDAAGPRRAVRRRTCSNTTCRPVTTIRRWAGLGRPIRSRPSNRAEPIFTPTVKTTR